MARREQLQSKSLHRPIQCLYPLEINSQEKVEPQPIIQDPGDNSGNSDKAAVRRSKRSVASEAHDRTLAQSLSLDEN